MLVYLLLLTAATTEPTNINIEAPADPVQNIPAEGATQSNPVKYPAAKPPINIRAPDLRRPAKPKNNPGNWATEMDFPARALKERRQGISSFQLEISPDGRVLQCNITASSGHADLDATTCTLILRRGRFDPATDEKGAPVTGKWSNRVKWTLPSEAFLITRGKVPKLAPGFQTRLLRSDYPISALQQKQSGEAEVKLDVGENGEVADCKIMNSSGVVSLDEQSCTIARSWRYTPLRDNLMNPVASIVQYRFSWLLPL